MTDKEKRNYLLQWYWTEESHPDGFKVYSHDRFPGRKYRLNRACEVMKENEPSTEPIMTISKDDPNGVEKLKEFLTSILDPDYEKKKAISELADFIGVDPENVRKAIDSNPF